MRPEKKEDKRLHSSKEDVDARKKIQNTDLEDKNFDFSCDIEQKVDNILGHLLSISPTSRYFLYVFALILYHTVYYLTRGQRIL